MPDYIGVVKSAVFVGAEPGKPKKIFNGNGGKLFYKNTSAVAITDTEVAVGSSVTTEENLWIISETESKVTIEPAIIAPAGVYGGGSWNPVAATSGTDTTPAEKKLFVTSFHIGTPRTVTGVGYMVGSVGGTNKAVAGIWNSKGTLLGASSETTEGTLVGTAAEYQELALTSPLSLAGPSNYFLGITMNGNTARFRSLPKNTAGSVNILSKEITITTKNVLAAITAPATFEADKGPIGWVY